MKRIFIIAISGLLSIGNGAQAYAIGSMASESSGSISTGLSTGLEFALPCNPASVANGSVDARTCVITCSSGYVLSGTSCNAVSSGNYSGGGGGGGGGSSSDSCPNGDLSGNAFDGKCTASLTGSVTTSSGGTVPAWTGSTTVATGTGAAPTWTGTVNDGNGTIVPIATDISGNWAQNHISVLIRKGIVRNAENFRPDDSLTRAEFLKIVGNSAGWDLGSMSGVVLPFADLSETPWAKPYLQYAVSQKIVGSSNAFRPNDNITRAEVAKILAVSLKLETKAYAGLFRDVKKSMSLAVYVEAMKTARIFEWQRIGESLIFRPDDNITRAEIAKVVVSAFQLK